MDVLDYRMEVDIASGKAELYTQKITDVEGLNHGFYFHTKEGLLASVPYGDMGQVIQFLSATTFHLYLFRKDAAYAKAAFRKFLKKHGMDDLSQIVAKKSFQGEEDLPQEPMDKDIRDEIRKDDRSKLIHRGDSRE